MADDVPVRIRLKAVLATKGTTLNPTLRRELIEELDSLDEAQELLTRAYGWIPEQAAGLRLDIRVHIGWPHE